MSFGGSIYEGLINLKGMDQAIRRLRDCFIPALKDLKPNKFIEAFKKNHLRLSTHPRFIRYNKDKLLAHENPKVRMLAQKLP